MAEQTAQATAEDTEKKSGVSDFLVAPKKKRKNYIIIAMGDNIDDEFAKSIEQHVRSQYPAMAVATPRAPGDLTRLFAKLVSLLIIDDRFMGNLTETLATVGAAKRRKGASAIPTLFLTEDPDKLIDEYHRSLLTFHEVDEFLPLRNLRPPVLHMRIRSALRDAKRRRSRRFEVDLPVSYFDLNTGMTFPGKIIDMSLHGAILRSTEDRIFRVGDQIRVSIDASRYSRPLEGEFLKLSAKVRRVMISGNEAGISFEYMNDRQQTVITKMLSQQMAQQLAVKRAQVQIPKRADDKPAAPKKPA